MSTLELEKIPLQVRETFRAAKNTPLGVVQVADELGFAYLDQDIDFGAIGRNEIFQNIKFIILTEYFSVPLDREFGMDYSMVDKPMRVAELVLVQEVATKIALYEPRAQFREIKFAEDWLNGHLSPSVIVNLLTTAELPSLVPPGGAATAAVGGPAGKTIEEIDLPGFYESLIEMARVPGPPGPPGPKGAAATVEAGETTTGEPGTEAEVVNVGDSSAAIFDFTIPKGDKGDQGTGITVKGTVPTSGSLPTTGNQPGDMWIATDTGHGWTWDGDSWVDAGPIQGPVGPEGPVGAEGPTGPTGATGATGPPNVLSVSETTTGEPGTDADVIISGISPSQSLAFTIPTGAPGPQGIQGPTGSQGIQGAQGLQGVNAFTITSANFDVPVEGASVVVTLADASWVTIGQMVVVQTAGGALADAHSFEVIAKAGNQVTLTNIGTTYITGSGDVVGPAGAANESLATFDGTSGKLIKSTPIATIVPVGGVLQTKFFENPANLTSNVVIPADGSTPQSGEGAQIASMVFTPFYANSWIRLTVTATVGLTGAAAGWMTIALFRNPLATAIFWQQVYMNAVAGAALGFALDKFDLPASVNPITYTLRMGPGVGTQTMSIAGAGPITFAAQEIKQ